MLVDVPVHPSRTRALGRETVGAVTKQLPPRGRACSMRFPSISLDVPGCGYLINSHTEGDSCQPKTK